MTDSSSAPCVTGTDVVASSEAAASSFVHLDHEFVCLFVYADGKEKQIEAAALAKQLSRSWDLAARPRTILLLFNPLMLLRG